MSFPEQLLRAAIKHSPPDGVDDVEGFLQDKLAVMRAQEDSVADELAQLTQIPDLLSYLQECLKDEDEERSNQIEVNVHRLSDKDLFILHLARRNGFLHEASEQIEKLAEHAQLVRSAERRFAYYVHKKMVTKLTF